MKPRLICTDQWPSYEGIADENTIHATVNHAEKEWVRGFIHTNTLENVWSLFKRSIVGSYHQISVKHMDRYLDEFEFRFNNRSNPYLFRGHSAPAFSFVKFGVQGVDEEGRSSHGRVTRPCPGIPPDAAYSRPKSL
jgi:hypothetical protein